jgi:hypothetical protein
MEWMSFVGSVFSNLVAKNLPVEQSSNAIFAKERRLMLQVRPSTNLSARKKGKTMNFIVFPLSFNIKSAVKFNV